MLNVRQSAVFALAGLGAILMAPNANAATLSYTVNYPLTLTDDSTTVLLPQFNHTLGSLTSAQIFVNSTIQQSFTIKNNNPHARTVGATAASAVCHASVRHSALPPAWAWARRSVMPMMASTTSDSSNE